MGSCEQAHVTRGKRNPKSSQDADASSQAAAAVPVGFLCPALSPAKPGSTSLALARCPLHSSDTRMPAHRCGTHDWPHDYLLASKTQQKSSCHLSAAWFKSESAWQISRKVFVVNRYVMFQIDAASSSRVSTSFGPFCAKMMRIVWHARWRVSSRCFRPMCARRQQAELAGWAAFARIGRAVFATTRSRVLCVLCRHRLPALPLLSTPFAFPFDPGSAGAECRPRILYAGRAKLYRPLLSSPAMLQIHTPTFPGPAHIRTESTSHRTSADM